MGDLITLSCPSCGGKLEVDANTSILICQHCGTEHIVNRSGGSITLESYARCPICRRNDRVEKITSLLRKENPDSQLAISLASPKLPDGLPRPSLKPKPELLPKPEPLPKPKLLPKPAPKEKPKLILSKPKKSTLTIGIILLVLGYFLLAVTISILIEEWDTGVAVVLLCFSFTHILTGIFLMYKGYTAKKDCTSEYADSYELANIKMNEDKLTKKSIVIIVASMLITIFCLFISFFSLSDDISISLFFVIFSLLPLFFGLFYFLRKKILRKIYSSNQLKLEIHEQVIDEWQKKNEILNQKWELDNERILSDWKNKNLEIVEEW